MSTTTASAGSGNLVVIGARILSVGVVETFIHMLLLLLLGKAGKCTFAKRAANNDGRWRDGRGNSGRKGAERGWGCLGSRGMGKSDGMC